jgi:DNA-directed RNA polymerase subunit RPC12/RpoP
MAEEYTCIECENLYDDTDGDTDERMCNKCLDKIYFEELKIKSKKQVKLAMIKVDKFIDWVKGEQRDPNIQRSSTVHYPDWDKKKKVYIVPPNKRKINEMNDAIKLTPEYKLGKKLLDGEISNVTIDSIIDKESGVE